MKSREWKMAVGLAGAVLLGLALWGCTYVPNQFKEDGPSVFMSWQSPTEVDVRAHYAPAAQEQRGWPETVVAADSGSVPHPPLYFEDPFEDKGDGRTDAKDPHNVYRSGWEDDVALPYCFARFTLNWMLLPASAIVTPPWVVLESDGKVSKQILWRDHDAFATSHTLFEPGPPEPVERPRAEEAEKEEVRGPEE
jgi:hypothetical protein